MDALELVYHDDVVKLFWDSSARYHISEWHGHASGERLRRAAHACLSASRERPSASWLADISDFSVIDDGDRAWIAAEFYPLLARNGIRRVAFVVPARPAAESSVRRVNEAYGEKGRIRFEYCATRADAIRALAATSR